MNSLDQNPENFGEVSEHDLNLSLANPPLEEIEPGGTMFLRIAVSCPSTCDLRGGIVRVIADEQVLLDKVPLSEFFGELNVTEPVRVEAPGKPGEYSWLAVFPAQTLNGCQHRETSLPINFRVTNYPVGMAVWNIASPVAVSSELSFIVGAKSFAEFSFAGKSVDVVDNEDRTVTTVTLSDNVYSDTVDLYWSKVHIPAPAAEGRYTWKVKVRESELEESHEKGIGSFSFTVVPEPDCTLTVTAIDKETKKPIQDARVAVRPNLYKARTNAQGVAVVQAAKSQYEVTITATERVPAGIPYHIGDVPVITRGTEYKVYVPEANKENFQPFSQIIDLTDNMEIKTELIGVIEPSESDTL